jgi:hypothetical protein
VKNIKTLFQGQYGQFPPKSHFREADVALLAK